MKKYSMYFMLALAALWLAGCSGHASRDNEAGQSSLYGAGISINLSDDGVSVDGKAISTDSSAAVYAGADIVYYEKGKGETYGEGGKKDSHSKEEAGKHTVITITKPGTYIVSGTLSFGQIAIDLGKDSKKEKGKVVSLVLNNTEISCSVAPAIVVYNAYECGSKKEKDAAPTVDTKNAGFNLILAQNSENIINGSYVAKIYEDGATRDDVEKGNAKKKYKLDAAIDSHVSFNIDSQENGKLIVNAENEGISSDLHLTINHGEITINAADDAINANKENVSVLTINGGVIACNSGAGDEGDGIDSNGYIVINGGHITAFANPESMDKGLDSDRGIYINGGTLFAGGNLYDEVSGDSGQLFMALEFDKSVEENELIMLSDGSQKPIAAFAADNAYRIAVYSSPQLTEGAYYLHKVSSVKGDLNGNIYTNIVDYQDGVRMLLPGRRDGGLCLGKDTYYFAGITEN